MLNHKTYALFLTPRGNERNRIFQTTGGPQGVFDIPTTSASRLIKSHSALEKDPIWKYHDMEVRAFLRQLRQAVRGEHCEIVRGLNERQAAVTPWGG